MNKSEYLFISFDPVAFSIGPLDVHWYGITYFLAFLTFWGIGNWQAKNRLRTYCCLRPAANMHEKLKIMPLPWLSKWEEI